MILKKNFLKGPKRIIQNNKLDACIFLFLIIFLSGCFVKTGREINNQVTFSDFSADNMINNISGKISSAEKDFLAGKLNSARQNCDLALEELLSIKNRLSVKEYEQLHGRIALIRIKINHSPKSEISIVESDLFPLVWNSRVEKWIKYYSSGKGKKYFSGWMERSKKYIGLVRDILRENELPLDLAYVPVIESGYYPFARSSVGAVGLWQFTESTGKSVGLNIDYWKDERRDPYKATHAAARLLRDLYNRFGSWEMALAAYNYGPNGVGRKIKKWRTSDYWELYLPRETEDFVPKIMAAIFIIKEPELFGMKTTDTEPIRLKEYTVKDSVDLRDAAGWAQMSIGELQLLNPELKQLCTPPGKEYGLKLPEEHYEAFVKTFISLDKEDLYLTKTEIDKRIRRVVYYRVRPGDNIWKISRKYGVSMRNIKKWNNLVGDKIFPRQKLKIYRHGL